MKNDENNDDTDIGMNSNENYTKSHLDMIRTSVFFIRYLEHIQNKLTTKKQLIRKGYGKSENFRNIATLQESNVSLKDVELD